MGIEAAIDAGAVEADALQQLYILPDVSDFRIEAWYEVTNQWGPLPNVPLPFAIYWKIPDFDPDPVALGFNIDGIPWWSETELGPPTVSFWPSALRFTFTLYDRDRRYFPDGKTFTYIVKLPSR